MFKYVKWYEKVTVALFKVAHVVQQNEVFRVIVKKQCPNSKHSLSIIQNGPKPTHHPATPLKVTSLSASSNPHVQRKQ